MRRFLSLSLTPLILKGAVVYDYDAYMAALARCHSPAKCFEELHRLSSGGNSLWEVDISDHPSSFQFNLLARLIEIIQMLHSNGLMFPGINTSSTGIRFDSHNPNHVYIWDLEPILPSTDSKELHASFQKLTKLIPSPVWSSTFADATETDALSEGARTSPPPYQLWIDTFRALANGADVRLVGDKLSTYYAPKYAEREISFSSEYKTEWGGYKQIGTQLHFPAIIRPPVPVAGTLNPSGRKIFSRIQTMLNEQVEMDSRNPHTRPYLLYDGELVPMDTSGSLSVVRLGKQIAKVDHVTVFETQEPAGYVVKYENNCESVFARFPAILRDYKFQKLIQERIVGTKISPRVVWLSPPVALPEYITPKIATTDERYSWCIGSHDPYQAQVRYMVMEKADEMVFEDLIATRSISEFERLKLGLTAIVQLVTKLELVHNLGIIHGDVHIGNVVRFKGQNGAALEFGFIDFGLSVFEGEFSSPECANNQCQTVKPLSEHKSCWLSFWNLLGHRLAFRDDVFNAVMIASFIMNGAPQLAHCEGLKDFVPQMIQWKRDEFFFDLDEENVILKALGLSKENELSMSIRRQMRRGLDLVRSVPRPESRPPYTAIVESFQRALDMLAPIMSIVDKSMNWYHARALDEYLPISNFKRDREKCSGPLPYQVAFPDNRGKVTFSLACTADSRCLSVQPPKAYMYSVLNFKEKNLLDRLRHLRQDWIAYTDCAIYEDASRSTFSVASRRATISPGKAAAIAVRVIDIMKEIHRVGGLIGKHMHHKLCMSRNRVASLEICSISSLDMFVDVRTRMHIPMKSRLIDFDNFIDFTEYLKKVIPPDDRAQFSFAIHSLITKLGAHKPYDVPKYDEFKALFAPLVGDYEDPAIGPIPKSEDFIDLVPVEGEIDWNRASSAQFALSHMPTEMSEIPTYECPMNGQFMINGQHFKFENCDKNQCLSTDGRMKKIKTVNLEKHREASLASSSLGFNTVVQSYPLLGPTGCHAAYQYMRNGGTSLNNIPSITAKVVKNALELLGSIHKSGLLFRGPMVNNFIMFDKDEMAARNLPAHLQMFVDATTGQHIKNSPTRKDDVLRLLSELEELVNDPELSGRLHKMETEVQGLSEQAAPPYTQLIQELAAL